MSLRVTQNNLFNNTLYYLQQHQQNLDDISTQLATGKQINRPSDDPVNSVRILGLKTDLMESKRYKENIADGTEMLNAIDTTLKRAQDIAQRARTLAIQGGTDSLTQQDRDMIADEINQLLEESVTTANTKFQGRYLFGGGETLDNPYNGNPFTVVRNNAGDITEVKFVGNKVPEYREYDENQNVQINMYGDEAFYAQNEVITSAATITNSSGNSVTIQNPARELDTYLPNSPTEGYFRINGVDIYYDKDGQGTTTAGDSLLDIANRITNSDAGVTAKVAGYLVGMKGFADPTAAIGFGAAADGNNTIAVNGVDIKFNTNDSLNDIVTRLNNVTSSTNVTASTTQDSQGLYHIVLSGGAEIDDVAVPPKAGVFTTLGITTSDQSGVTAPNNLIETVTSSAAVSDPTALLSTEFSGDATGNINVNGTDVNYVSGVDTLNSLAAKIDAIAGVTSYVNSSNQLVIAGQNIKIDTLAPVPPAAPQSNIFDENRLQIQSSTGNDIGVLGPRYQLELTSNNPGQIAMEDIGTGKLLSQDLMMTDELKNPANNYTSQTNTERISLFQALITLRDDLTTGGSSLDNIRGRDIGYFDNYINNSGAQRATAGAKINRLEAAESRRADFEIGMTDALSRTEDVDLSELVTALQKQQTVTQASMAASAKIMQISLLNFL